MVRRLIIDKQVVCFDDEVASEGKALLKCMLPPVLTRHLCWQLLTSSARWRQGDLMRADGGQEVVNP